MRYTGNAGQKRLNKTVLVSMTGAALPRYIFFLKRSKIMTGAKRLKQY